MATLAELQVHLGTLAVILWNYGASFPVPTLDSYQDTGNLGFSFTADLAGSDFPGPAIIKLSEIWAPRGSPDQFSRYEYEYAFVEHPLNRRRAFHLSDPDFYAREFGVLVHEHCEEAIGAPACGHYYGLPVTAYEAIDRFTSMWGQAGPLGCAGLRCMYVQTKSEVSMPNGSDPIDRLHAATRSMRTTCPTRVSPACRRGSRRHRL